MAGKQRWRRYWGSLSDAGVYSGTTTANLSISNVSGLGGRIYRVMVSTGACQAQNSAQATLTVEGPITIGTDPMDVTVCPGSPTSFSVGATNGGGGILVYQWEISTDGGTTWNTLSNGGTYSGVTASTLNISNASGLDGYQYRVLVSTGICPAMTSNEATLTLDMASPTANAGSDEVICGNGDPFNLAMSATPPSFTNGNVVWSTNGTGTFNNANLIHPVYTPSAADIANGNVTLTLVVTGTGMCVFGAANDFMILYFDVNNTPAANAGSNETVCINIAAYDLSTSTTPPSAGNGNIIWVTSGTGTFSAVNALHPIYTPSAMDKANGSVNLTMTVTGNNGACVGELDADGMILSFSAALNITSATWSVDTAICAGGSAGIRLTVVGGTGPYDIEWTDGSNNFSQSNYVSGTPINVSPAATRTYTLTSITDARACPGTGILGDQVVVTVNPLPNAGAMTATAADICLGENGAVTIGGLANGNYTLTYNLAAPNAATGLTGAVSVSGTGVLTIPAANLAVATATQGITIVGLLDANGCAPANPVSLNDNFAVNALPDVTNLSATAADICIGADGVVEISGLADGAYTITYDLAAPNAAVGLTGMVTSSGGTGELTILAANLTNTTATQAVTITSVEDANGCTPASVLATTADFEINALPDVTNLDASAVDICLGDDGTVTVTGLADGTYTITYNLAAPNAAVGLTGMVTSSGGTGELTIPAANLTSVAATQTVTITSAEDANGCAPASVLTTTADFEINGFAGCYELRRECC